MNVELVQNAFLKSKSYLSFLSLYRWCVLTHVRTETCTGACTVHPGEASVWVNLKNYAGREIRKDPYVFKVYVATEGL